MKIKNIFNGKYIYIFVTRIADNLRDKKIGGKTMNKTIDTKYAEKGAYGTQSTGYAMLNRIFGGLELSKDDIVADIGCGQGRVISYLLQNSEVKKIYGIELDGTICAEAKKRFEKYPQTEIICGDILEYIPEDVTVFYLYNPFHCAIFHKFVYKIEAEFSHPVRMVYCFDIYSKGLSDRPGWECIVRENVKRPYKNPMHYSIFRFDPDKMG